MSEDAQQITTIDRDTARILSEECAVALHAVASKYGLELVRKAGTFGARELNVKFQLRSAEVGDGGVTITRESQTFKSLAPIYGLSPDDLGREFTTSNGRYKITGLVPRRGKYPIQAVCVVTGKGFKFSADTVKLHLNMSK